MDFVGQQLVFAVAQRSFEANNNCFSTLRPISTLTGEPVDPRNFRNRGLVWWMAKGLEFQTATPGRLIIATVEDAKEADPADHDKDEFQVAVSTVKWAAPRLVIEVLRLPARWSDPSAILSEAVAIVDHDPTTVALVRMGDTIYGPFRTEAKSVSASEDRYEVRFLKQLGERPIFKVPARDLPTSDLTAEVTNEARAPNRATDRRVCRYELACWPEFERASAKASTIDLVTDEELIKRAARRVLTKGQANELVGKLKEVQAGLAEEGPDQDHERIAAIIQRQATATEAVTQLADALAASEQFKPRLDAAIDRAVDIAIQSRASTIRAKAEAELSVVSPALEVARAELHTVREELERERRRGLARLDEELSAARTKLEADLAEQEAAANDRLERLRREQAAVQSTLASATERLRVARTDAMEDFLVLQPVMQALGQASSAVPVASAPTASEGNLRRRSEISLPAVLQSERLDRPALEEEAYFERLCRHIKDSGFIYRRYDLAAFHVAMKVSDLSVLGGVSGTGKSSLPMLYAQALAGEDGGVSERYLPIDVSPAWTSPSDLLGYVNLLDHSFSPGSSGLFSRLAQAALEYKTKSSGSGLHIICLEEMNLAQVEYYFSAFIQALSRDPASRDIAVFDPSALDDSDPLRVWAKIPLHDNVRFSGTVNFDETTRSISQRVLDRSDLIQLNARDLTDGDRPASTSSANCRGPAVTLGDFRAWTAYRPLSQQAASLFEAIQPSLAALGCPLTPRRQTAIARSLASAERICAPSEALDMQIVQRVFPQIRGAFRPGARQALEAIESALGVHAKDCENARAAIAMLIQADESASPHWELE